MNKPAEYVSCFGSGTVRDDIREKSGNAFAVESCHIKIADSDVAAHIWRFLYDTARQYRESFDVYGSKKVIRVDARRGRAALLAHREAAGAGDSVDGSRCPISHICCPSRSAASRRSILDADHLSFLQGGGHGGSHPHLVNEFISALVEDRDPWPNATTSANWTCVGILAHESALAGGEIRQLPEFTRK